MIWQVIYHESIKLALQIILRGIVQKHFNRSMHTYLFTLLVKFLLSLVVLNQKRHQFDLIRLQKCVFNCVHILHSLNQVNNIQFLFYYFSARVILLKSFLYCFTLATTFKPAYFFICELSDIIVILIFQLRIFSIKHTDINHLLIFFGIVIPNVKQRNCDY
jgi:hypothetical protein